MLSYKATVRICYDKFQHAKIFDNGFRVGVDKIWWRCDAGGARVLCVFAGYKQIMLWSMIDLFNYFNLPVCKVPHVINNIAHAPSLGSVRKRLTPRRHIGAVNM